MGINLLEEYKRAEFIDWINNNINNIKEYLLLEEEELLKDLFENHKKLIEEWEDEI